MKIKGTIHLIHQEDSQWMFLYKEDGIDKRVPFVFYSGFYEDGQEIECYLETLVGVERAKPLFSMPNVNKPDVDETLS